MILCCGEALIDMLPRATASGETAFLPCAGGAAFNTAIALGRLGVPAGLFSGLSADFMGELLRDALTRANVDYARAASSSRPTTLAFVQLVDGHARYAFYDENTAGRMLAHSDLPAPDNDTTACLFGGVSLIAEPCGGVYEALMAREAPQRVMFLDPNIRANLMTDREKHLARLRRMITLADIVKLSDEDLAWFGESGSDEDITARWLARGPRLVVITRGAAGADAYSATARVRVAGKKVPVVDTVGAGDTVNAGILTSLHRQGLLSKAAIAGLSGEQIRAALELGVHAAAITVARAGANPPWASEMTGG
ncbi:carbohydrate kinase family protein [Acerihabitans arboris]|uniref:Carbohydrate kinase n=1 Tax=Acerihabitans arboris TaxID=2691583 RepID=A0A845SNF8_9GAMM|nr:carbohydrate kinase [Acerihabitans arboris]NDL64922.1 carbohydrate kinase [Acerihabitans arboris]